MSTPPARFRRRAAPADHFPDVRKMVGLGITQRDPAAGFYQRSSSQGFLDHSNRRQNRVTEDFSATANSAAHGVFTPRRQGKATVKESLTVQIQQRRKGTAEESSVVQIEGGRDVQRPVTLYSLDAERESLISIHDQTIAA
jgi:hypothetical protein